MRRSCCCCTAWATGPRRRWGRLVPQLDPRAPLRRVRSARIRRERQARRALRPALLPPRARTTRSPRSGLRALRAGRTLAGRLHRRRLGRRASRARHAPRADRAGRVRALAAPPRLRARRRRRHARCSPRARRARFVDAHPAPQRGRPGGARPRATSSAPYELAQELALREARSPACTPAPSHAFARARELPRRLRALRRPGVLRLGRARPLHPASPPCATSCASTRTRRRSCSQRSGHLPMVEEPAQLGAALRDFLRADSGALFVQRDREVSATQDDRGRATAGSTQKRNLRRMSTLSTS